MKEINVLKNMSIRTYCLFVGFALLFTGLLLFMYALVFNIPFVKLFIFGNPLFYLPMGLIMILVNVFLYFVDKEETIS